MITMNYYCSLRLKKNKIGIFREVKIKDNDMNRDKISILPKIFTKLLMELALLLIG